MEGKAINPPELRSLRGSVDDGIKHVEALRRIFFSLLEHLRETAERQATLTDETRDVATLAEEKDLAKKIAPLIPRQQELASISRQIADSLKKQSEQSPKNLAGKGSPGQSTGSEPRDAAHRLARASRHVTAAREAMEQAAKKMTHEVKVLKTVEEDQSTAVQKLVEAIQLLSPPPQEQKQEDQQQQQNQQQAQQQNQGASQQQKNQQARQTDINQLLQSVRDRDAQRRRDKRQRSNAGYLPVEKDW